MIDVDVIAGRLRSLGDMGKSMPPSWKREGIHHPVCGNEGEVIGRMLPGSGLYLDCDLKYLGINKPVKNVVERSTLRRLSDKLADNSGVITTMKKLASAPTQLVSTVRLQTTGATVSWWDGFEFFDSVNGNSVGAFANIPGSVLDQTTTGSMNKNMFTPSGSNTVYLVSLGVNVIGNGFSFPTGYANFMVVDTLVGTGNILSNTNSLQSIATPALNRYTSGAGVMMYCGSNASSGTTLTAGTTLTITYTNQAGTINRTSSGTVSTNHTSGNSIWAPTGDTIGFGFPFCLLQSGDYGVQSITSFTAGTAATTGNVVMFLYYPLMFVCATQNEDDYFEVDLPTRIEALVPLTTTAGGVLGCLNVLCNQYNQNSTGSLGVQFTFRTVQG